MKGKALEINLGDGRHVAIQPYTDVAGKPGYQLRFRRPEDFDVTPTCRAETADGEIRTYISLTPEALGALALLIDQVEPAAVFRLASEPEPAPEDDR